MSTSRLRRLDEFKDLLSRYGADESSRKAIGDKRLIVLVSPTSAGRNTVISGLSETGKYVFVPSDTTRAPRENNGVLEEDGVEYFFVSEEVFLDGLKKNDYIEAKLVHNQQVSGTSLSRLEHYSNLAASIVIEANFQGAREIHELKPDATFIFVLPPSFEIWMERLQKRGFMSQDEFLERLRSAEQEIQAALDDGFYKIVVNDQFRNTISQVRDIVENGSYTEEQEQYAHKSAWKLLNTIKEHLGS